MWPSPVVTEPSPSVLVQSILRGPKMKRAVRTVEVDVWPPLSDCEQLRALALCGEHVAKYEDQPRLLESPHHKAIMVLAEFLWRLASTPPPVRVCPSVSVLLPGCVLNRIQNSVCGMKIGMVTCGLQQKTVLLAVVGAHCGLSILRSISQTMPS